ncbi:MAG: LCP family protein [Candidatus Uhrbacteria bacterium]
MEQHKIDFLKEKYRLNFGQRRSFVFFGKFFASALVVTALVGACLSYKVPSGGDLSSADVSHFSLFATLRDLISSGDKELKGEKEDRVNFLLLGVGGEGHDGAQLTDTIIFASLRPSDKAMGMVSIPRDLTVPVPDEGWRKINAVNALAEAKETGSGPLALANVVQPLFNQTIQYYIRVDFDGFADLIDALGGINIYVEKSFSDSQYPVDGMEDANCGTVSQTDENGLITENPVYGCRFEVLTFQEGWAQMDGALALKYVRSRHGTNGEASDFARSRRQQSLIIALKDKILSLDTLSRPSKVSAIISMLDKHIKTNLSLGEIIKLGREYGNIDTSKIVNQVLDTSPGGPLYDTSMNGAYVILPKNDDWLPLQSLAENIFTPNALSTIAKTPEAQPKFVKVEIQNGTTISGLAFETSQLLSSQGFEITKIGNAKERGFTKTIIYDLTNGQKADELKDLQQALEAEVAMSTTGWIYSGEIVPQQITVTDENTQTTSSSNIDFLIILGENSANLVRR